MGLKLPDIKILDEKNKILHQKSEEVTFPLSVKDKKNIKDMLLYLKMSQIDEYNKKYNLRAGMGLAYPQIGILKRICLAVLKFVQTYYNLSLNKIRFLLSIDFEKEIETIFKLLNTKDIAKLLEKNT